VRGRDSNAPSRIYGQVKMLDPLADEVDRDALDLDATNLSGPADHGADGATRMPR
jgi:hypothetical protein